MERDVESNAQNSELDPKLHPSGARIEKIIHDWTERRQEVSGTVKVEPERGQYGETLRPSEREEIYVPPESPSEGARDEVSGSSTQAPHRMKYEDRLDR